MLGRFLEFSVHCADVAQSLQFYAKLGFTPTAVNDAWAHAYAVVTDGRLYIGLHGTAPAPAALTFVRPDILGQTTLLESRGVELEYRHLGNGVFNEIGVRDPGGTLLRMIEARSFSPSGRKPTDTSTCGYFQEIALPAAQSEPAKTFWESLGFVGMDEPDALLPHVSCTSDSVNVGLYDQHLLREPALIFEADDLHVRMAKLTAGGLDPERQLPPPLRGRSLAMYRAPEGTQVLMLGVRE